MDVVLHVLPGMAAEGAVGSVNVTGKAIVTANQLDGGSPWDRMDGRIRVEVVANVVALTVLNECLMVKVLKAYMVGFLSMTRCTAGKESTVAMFAK